MLTSNRARRGAARGTGGGSRPSCPWPPTRGRSSRGTASREGRRGALPFASREAARRTRRTWRAPARAARADTGAVRWRTCPCSSGRLSNTSSDFRAGRCGKSFRYIEPLSNPLDAAPLGGAAAVVRDGGDVADERDLEAGGGDGTQRGLAARSRALHHHPDGLEAV